MTSTETRWLVLLVALTLVAGAFAIGNSAHLGSPDSVLRIPQVSHGRHLGDVFSVEFTRYTEGRYEPLPYAVLAVARTFVSADNAWFWPAWLLAFHIVNGLLVYRVARHFAEHPIAALVAAGVFLLHPAASAFITQPNLFPIVLTATLYLAALAGYLSWSRDGRPRALVASVGLFLAGLLTSRVMLTLPVLVLLIEIFHERRGIRRALLLAGPFAAGVALWAVVVAPLHPATVFFVARPAPPGTPFGAWVYSFGSGGIDALLALAAGSDLAPATGALCGRPGDATLLAPLVLGIVFLGALVAALALLRKRLWFAAGVFLLFLASAPAFASSWELSTDDASWRMSVLAPAGLALVAGALVDALLRVRAGAWLRPVAVASGAVFVLLAAGLAVGSGRARNAERYWRHALAANPHSEVAAVELGRACMAQGDVDEAWTHLFAPTLRTMRASCLTAADYYARRGDPAAAVAHMAMADREYEYGFRSHVALRRRAEVFVEIGAWDYAEQYLGQALMVEPDDVASLRALARILAAKGFPSAARRCLVDAARVDPRDVETSRALSALDRVLGQPETRVAAVRLNPPPPELLRYASDMQQSGVAREPLIALAATHPGDAVILLTSGIVLGQAGRYDEALAPIDRSIQMLPSWSYTWASRCWALANAGRVDDARKALRRVVNPREWDAVAWHRFGYTLSLDGKHDLAADIFRFILNIDPTMLEAHNNLGVLLAQQGKFPEALNHLTAALALPRSRLGAVHNALGFVRASLDEPDRAAEHFRASLALDPKRPRTWQNLADLYSSEGRFAETRQILRDGLSANPRDPALSLRLAWLYAAAPSPDLRDAGRAVRLAESVLRKSPSIEALDCAAAAYAEAGRFDDAQETAYRAAVTARSMRRADLASDIEERRRLYEMRTPYRMSAPKRSPSTPR